MVTTTEQQRVGSVAPSAKMVTLTIDGIPITVEEHTTILEAARQAHITIPTLCYLKGICEVGSCRMCVVEIEGIDQLVASCNNVVLDGMVVHTHSNKVRQSRRSTLQMLLSRHRTSCTSCVRNTNCELLALSQKSGVYNLEYPLHLRESKWDKSVPLIRDNSKCVDCLRCVEICEKVQASYVWDVTSRSLHRAINVRDGKAFSEVNCTYCGQCVTHCPTGALRERDDTERMFAALADPNITTIVQIAPSVRTAWGEAFGLSKDQVPLGKLVQGLKNIGFDYVINTDFSADLTIMEEGSELVEHLAQEAAKDPKSRYPMFTSCCPGWVRFVKAHYPELVPHVSSSKSPQQMFGAIVKSYYAELLGVDPHTIYSVSIMPCMAKKAEVLLPGMDSACGDPDVDLALTVREVDRMLLEEQVNVAELSESAFDEPLGYGSGAGIIFGATGGVMEAALRTAYYLVCGEAPKQVRIFDEVRGQAGWKEATFMLGDTKLKVAVASGLANAKALCDAICAHEVDYDFVEVMACPGGCVGGGGQPIHPGEEKQEDFANILYQLDDEQPVRYSYQNPAIQECYKNYLDKPLSPKAHHLLHVDHNLWQMPFAAPLE